MKTRLAAGAVLAVGIALTTAVFFASANVTHWVMGLHRTDVVVRPGPTVYVTLPATPRHARHHAQPAQVPAVPAVPAVGGGSPSQQDARVRPDHRRDHVRPHHGGDHARRQHGDAHAWGLHKRAHAWQGHRKRCHQGHRVAHRTIPAGTVTILTVAHTAEWWIDPGSPQLRPMFAAGPRDPFGC